MIIIIIREGVYFRTGEVVEYDWPYRLKRSHFPPKNMGYIYLFTGAWIINEYSLCFPCKFRLVQFPLTGLDEAFINQEGETVITVCIMARCGNRNKQI